MKDKAKEVSVLLLTIKDFHTDELKSCPNFMEAIGTVITGLHAGSGVL
jgi:hypothetical protein